MRILPSAEDLLDAEGILYKEVNIEDDPEAAAWVMGVNGGNQTVPTVRFEDDTALTNPSLAQVKRSSRLDVCHMPRLWSRLGHRAGNMLYS
ncbi:hypothetical protein GCM10029992_25600 [Glycomyces albus]